MKESKNLSIKAKNSTKNKLKNKIFVAIICLAVVISLIVAYRTYRYSKVVKQGDFVLVDYVASVDNKIFDTTIERVAKNAGIYNPQRNYKPVIVRVGAGKFILGFEDAIFGMREGETKTITVTSERAYGEYDPTKVITIDKSLVNASENINVGTILKSKNKTLRVISVNETSIIADANHPLAGKNITFKIHILKVIGPVLGKNVS
ncbi:MAG: FKBP-type peptidyl-prolyl cis-trans isomerase [Candidatus Woesearchaeota archaeon]